MITLLIIIGLITLVATYIIAFVSILGFIVLDIAAFIFVIYLIVRFIKNRFK